MKFSVLLAVIFFVLAVVFVSSVSLVNYNVSGAVFANQMYGHLETAVQSRADHLETFFDSIEIPVRQMSQSVVLSRFLVADKGADFYESYLNDALVRLKKSVNVSPEISDIFVLDEFGIVVASTLDERVGLDFSDENYFFYGKDDAYVSDVYFSDFLDQSPSISISYPIRSDSGDFLGVTVTVMNLNVLQKITMDRTGLMETGEIYIVNREGLLITPSRFNGSSILAQAVNTENLESCFGGEKGSLTVFKDYRGEDVIETYEYLQEMDWCIFAKIDMSEVESGQRRLFINGFLFPSFVFIFLVSFVAYFVGRFYGKKFGC